MHAAFHHILKRKHKESRERISHRRLKATMDKSVYVFTFFGICANIPQLAKIWIDRNIGGVAIITWLGFLLGSFFWLCYGIIHKEKPIIVANAIYVAVQFFIVLGLFIQGAQFTIL